MGSQSSFSDSAEMEMSRTPTNCFIVQSALSSLYLEHSATGVHGPLCMEDGWYVLDDIKASGFARIRVKPGTDDTITFEFMRTSSQTTWSTPELPYRKDKC